MPNPSNTPNQFPQNGRGPSDHNDRNGHGASSITLDAAITESPRSPNLQHGVNEEWSSVTEESINTMPRVWIRGLLYLLAIFTAIVLPWAMLSKVDETGSARGKLEPKGKTFELDAAVAGEVAEIKVKEGETLKQGQVLVKLKSDLTRTELQQAQAKLDGHMNRLSQLQLMKNQLQGGTMLTQQQQGKAIAAAQLAKIEETRQKLEHSKTQRNIASVRLARDQKEVERYRSLVDKGIVAEVQVVAQQRIVDATREDLNQASSDMQQAEAQLKAQQQQYQGMLRDNQLTLLGIQRQTKDLDSQIAALQGEINQTKEQIKSLKFQLQQREIRSPIDGVLFQLPIEKPGAVVQPGQLVAQIAPQNVPLVLRADMPSQESGFLEVGMPVHIKFDAYPYQDYGIVEGQVTWISPNSKMTQTPQGAIQTFELEVRLGQFHIQKKDKRIALTPGQTATAEVIVRQRRVIDFLLDPFKKLEAGGLEL
ncbi:MAG TPA: HlyD family efflux transporter periplasmic adaptor subunit [Coleofasciculaceae cyanobacterium]|jgi:HlyD family secretion protein